MVFISLIPLAFIGLSIAGLVCLTLGLRGRAVFSAPRCAKCKYDLRAMNFMAQDVGTCPECGAKLGAPRAVTFGKLQKWRGMLIAGIVMLVLPWLSLIVLIPVARMAMGGPTASASRTSAQLVAQLPTTIDQPWDWQELERRLKAGSLSVAEAETAIGALATDLNAKRAKGQQQGPLHWAGSFVNAALQMQGFSPQKKQAFLQAFYGDGPTITMRRMMREGEPVRPEVESNSHWDLEGMQFCWSLKSVVADGTATLGVKDAYNGGSTAGHPDRMSGSQRYSHAQWSLQQQLPPGEHELVFTFDLGVTSNQATFRGLDGRPGTVEKWPAPIAVWQATVKQKIKVVGKGEAVIELVKDSSIDPIRDAGIRVESALVRPSSQGKELALKWKYSGPLSLPLVYRVEVMAGGQKFNLGQFLLAKTKDGGTSTGMPDACQVKSLAPEIRKIDLKFIPDPKVAEQSTGIERIFGGEAEIRDVPLERYDLDK